MSPSFASSIAPILAAPWQQRRNRNGLWSALAYISVCTLVPLGLLAWSVMAEPAAAANMRHAAAIAARAAAVALCVAWWTVLVNNVLEQNHPMLARLVPAHPGRLRAALLVAWAGMGAGLVGVVFAGVLDTLTGMAIFAPAAALLAASVRWTWLWIGAPVVPYIVVEVLHARSLAELGQVAQEEWRAQPASIAATLVMASGLLLASLIRAGGPRHSAAYARRRRWTARMQAAARGERVRGPGAQSVLENTLASPYRAWMRHLLARPASSPRARALLGLGPGVHWTGNFASLVATAAAIGVAMVLVRIVATVFPQVSQFVPMGLSGVAVGSLFGVIASAIQVQSRLHQTQREQSLLALLPGVPRGTAMNRWLSWQLTAQFLLSWAGGVTLMLAFSALARRLHFNPFEHGYATGRLYMVVSTLPLVAFQWRRWAWLAAPPSFNALFPTLFGTGLAALAFAAQFAGVATPLECGVVFALSAFAWCAWRWSRMDTEQSALPVGRLA